MINQLSFVTKKLQHHTLDEAANKVTKVTSEDQDSGTESDDEETFEETEIASEMSSEISSGCSVRSRPTSQTSTDTVTCDELPMGGEGPDMPPPPTFGHYPQHHPHHSQRKSTRHGHQYLLRTPNTSSSSSGRGESPPVGDAYYDAYDPVEHHSSEEELEPLTGNWSRDNAPPSEKRKWSQVARLSVTDSGSSDDEVCVLTTGQHPPVEFRTSPPLEAHKPLRSASPPSKMLNLASNQRSSHSEQTPVVGAAGSLVSISRSEGLGADVLNPGGALVPNGIRGSESGGAGGRATSPRKRHRHTPRPHRPSLDFEKMQQMKDRAVTQWRNGGELSLSFF